MNKLYPSLEIVGETLHVFFSNSEPTRLVKITCTVDLTDFGDVLGVEVLDWSVQLSGAVLSANESDGPLRWSYDDEIDAFYLHLENGRSRIQKTEVALASVDASNNLVCLAFPIPSEKRAHI
jgi:hypothetical protein